MTMTRLARLPGVRHLRAWWAAREIQQARMDWEAEGMIGHPREVDHGRPERIRRGEA